MNYGVFFPLICAPDHSVSPVLYKWCFVQTSVAGLTQYVLLMQRVESLGTTLGAAGQEGLRLLLT